MAVGMGEFAVGLCRNLGHEAQCSTVWPRLRLPVSRCALSSLVLDIEAKPVCSCFALWSQKLAILLNPWSGYPSWFPSPLYIWYTPLPLSILRYPTVSVLLEFLPSCIVTYIHYLSWSLFSWLSTNWRKTHTKLLPPFNQYLRDDVFSRDLNLSRGNIWPGVNSHNSWLQIQVDIFFFY